MVQPRKEQIKNLKTRHALVYFSPTPGSAYTDIIDPAVDAQVISDTPGGAQEDVPAFVLSTISESAYAIFPGAAIDVSIDGGPVSTVSLAVSDKASTIADNINTAIGADVAFNYEGSLGIRSDSLGYDTSVVLADNVGGSLAAIGLTAGTYTGADTPTRGVVTTSPITFASYAATAPSPIGAFVPIKDQRGKNITTDTSSIDSIEENFGFTVRRAYIPGGAPVHGRLSRNPANTEYRLAYYAQMPTEPEVVTFNSDFSLLDGTDAVTFTFNYKINGPSGISPETIVVPVTFPGPYPYDRDKTVDEINAAYASAASSAGGNARVIGRVPQPFNFGSATVMEISIDGGAFIPVAFNPAVDKDVGSVVSTINTAVGSVVASVVNSGTNNYVQISSLTTDGRTSSVEIRNNTGDPLATLGLRPGLYRGFFVAEPYGDEEIRIRGIARGSDASFTVGLLGPSTAARLGVSFGTYNGADLGEVKVDFPDIDFVDPTETHAAKALFPEVLEYGEVDPAVESIVEQFNVKALDNQWGNGADLMTDGYGVAAPSPVSRGTKDVGKPIYVNPFGSIDSGLTRDPIAHIEAILGKFVVGDLSIYTEQVDRLAAPVFETPSGPNPSAASSTMTFDLDPDGDFAPGSREYYFQIERDAASVTPWRLGENTPITGMSYEVRLSGYNVLRSNNYPLALSDPNVWASGLISGGLEYLNLSDSNNRYPHRFNVESSGDTPPHTILSKTNSIWTCTVGDGTNSFGDFSGTDAIQQAIAYWDTNVSGYGGIRIRCKAGYYDINAGNGAIVIPSNDVTVVIEGENADATTIRVTDGISPAIDLGLENTLHLRDLRLIKSATPNAIMHLNEGGVLHAENVNFTNFRLETYQANEYHLDKCEFSVGDTACIDIQTITGGDHGPLVARDCVFSNNVRNFPAVRIFDTGAITASTVKGLLFERCQFNLEGADNDGGGNFVGNAGVLELVPGSTGLFTLKDVTWKDCEVNANRGPNHTLLYLRCSDGVNEITVDQVSIIGGNWDCGTQGVTADFSPFYIGSRFNSDPSLVRRVIIEDVVMGFTGTNSSNYGSFPVEIDGGGWLAPDWAAFFINAGELIKIHNWTFPTTTVRSRTGDLFLFGPIKYDIQGIHTWVLNWLDTDDYGTPYQRVQFWGFTGASGYGDGVIGEISYNFPPMVNQAATKGIIKMVPAGRMTVQNCDIIGHNTVLSLGAFFLDGGEDSSLNAGLSLVNCRAIENGGNGFGFINETTGTTSRLHISGCTFEDAIGAANSTTACGICIYGTGTSRLYNCVVRGNICTNNDSYGIMIAPGDWGPPSHQYHAVVTDNTATSNNGSLTGVQIRIGDSTRKDGFDARMTLIGNMCGGSGTTYGAIEFTGNLGSAPVWAIGSHTGYDLAGADIWADPNGTDERLWNNAAGFHLMLMNFARYLPYT